MRYNFAGNLGKQSDGAMKTPFGQALRYNEKLPYSQKARWIITCNFDEIHIHDLEGPSEVPDVVIYLTPTGSEAKLASLKRGESLANPGGSARGQSSASRSNKNNLAKLKRKKDPDPFEIEAPLHSKALRSQLSFITDIEQARLHQEKRISLEAGRLVGKLYDGLLKQYLNPDDPQTLQSLNKLCVRLVFCLYAEDTNGAIFDKNQFHDYLANKSPQEIRAALIELFRALNLDHEARKKEYLTDEARAFPYVNGGLFADENVEIPFFTQELKALLLDECSLGFDWSPISPTIFGSLFESTLNKETRRKNGMHYTTVQNIHKVIDPLFLDALKAELASLKEKQSLALTKGQRARFKDEVKLFQNKLAKLRFLDPACGSGNFLTETYLSLRRLENEALLLMQEDDQIRLGFAESEYNPIKVSISQFYGIEINDFAVAVAKTALWIAEAQMRLETEDILSLNLDFLPLTTNAGIVEGNALRMDWEELLKKDGLTKKDLNYIMGNPPFANKLTASQKEDRTNIFSGKGGELDYVSCWFKKATDLIKDTLIQCAFIATNSICQGQQAVPLWKPLFKDGIIINFARTTFIWNSESIDKALVYVVIISFSMYKTTKTLLFDGDSVEPREVKQINLYLDEGENIFIEREKNALSPAVPYMTKGFQPTDNNYLLLTNKEKEDFIKKDPKTEKWIRPFLSAKEYLNGEKRWCLWLEGITPHELHSMPLIEKRVIACQEWRSAQVKTGDAFKLRNKPTLMRPNKRYKEGSFLVIPLITSGNREYIPIGFEENAIPGNRVSVCFDADYYHFGVLESKVHMAWMRKMAARYGPSYSYSSDIVYNTFPWPEPTPEQKAKIEQTAQKILEVRAKYPDSTLAELYKAPMFEDLKRAHTENDKAVMEAYGLKLDIGELEIFNSLTKSFQKFQENLASSISEMTRPLRELGNEISSITAEWTKGIETTLQTIKELSCQIEKL